MADGVAVDGVAFEDFPGTTLLVTPAAPGAVVTGTRIRGNRFTRPGVDAVRIVGGSLLTGGGGVEDTVVDGNTFEAGTPDNLVNGLTPAAINLFGAYLPVPGTVSGVRVTATTISHNAIRDIYYGVYARAADGPGTMSGNTIDGLTLDRNTCERVSDGCLVMAPTHVWGAGLSSDNALRNVRVTGNTFAGRAPGAPEYLGGAVFVSGGFLASCFDTTGTPTSLRDVASGVEITNNVVADRAPYGIFVQAAHSCGGAGGSLTDSVLEDVLVAGNLVRNSITGVSLQAASVIATGAGLTAARNTLRGVAVAGNTFEANSSTAVEVLGAYAAFAGGRTGRTTDNVVRDVLIEANVMAGNRHGLSAIGAIAASPAEEVARNAVSGLRVIGNRVAGTWTAGMLLQAGNATQGRAGDNVLEAVELSDNVIEAVSNVGILVMASFEGGGGRAEGNVIQAPLLARNQVRGVTRGEVFSGSGIALQGDAGNAVRAALLEANVVDGVAGHGIELYRTDGHTLVQNRVSGYGRKPFFGKKRRNTLVDNVFPKKRKRRR
jgi:hypothetical protein